MINLHIHNYNMRSHLNIPNNAIVFGGYGGKDSFSIKFVHNVVYEVAKKFKYLFFICKF